MRYQEPVAVINRALDDNCGSAAIGQVSQIKSLLVSTAPPGTHCRVPTPNAHPHGMDSRAHTDLSRKPHMLAYAPQAQPTPPDRLT